MRKNAVRKWLHAILDLLPLFVIPIFAINIINRSPEPLTVESNNLLRYDFNQTFDYNNKSQCWTFYGGATGTVDDTGITVNGIGRNGVVLGSNYRTNFDNDSVYYISFDYDTTVLFECQYANGAYTSRIDVGTGHYKQTSNTLNGKFYYFDFFPSISGATGTTQISNIMVINLTQMYGAGNEPSANDFYSKYNGVYYEFTESTYVYESVNVTYNDTDIGSQFVYSMYHTVNTYFNFGNIFGMTGIYNWFVANFFNGNAPLVVPIIWNIIVYEFIMDILFIIYHLFMMLIDFTDYLLDKPFDSVKRKR